jgi:hypothetical protein
MAKQKHDNIYRGNKIMKKSIHAALVASTALVSVAPAFAAQVDLLAPANSGGIVIDISGTAPMATASECTRAAGGGLSALTVTDASGVLASEDWANAEGHMSANYVYKSTNADGHVVFEPDANVAVDAQVYTIKVGPDPVFMYLDYRLTRSNVDIDVLHSAPYTLDTGLQTADEVVETVSGDFQRNVYKWTTPGTYVVTIDQAAEITTSAADGSAVPTAANASLLMQQGAVSCGIPADAATFDSNPVWDGVMTTDQWANVNRDTVEICQFVSATTGEMEFDDANLVWEITTQPQVNFRAVGTEFKITGDNDLYDLSGTSVATGDWNYADAMAAGRVSYSDAGLEAADAGYTGLSADKNAWTLDLRPNAAVYGEFQVGINGSLSLDSAEFTTGVDYSTRHTLTCVGS